MQAAVSFARALDHHAPVIATAAPVAHPAPPAHPFAPRP